MKIVSDLNGNVWLPSNHGLYKFNGTLWSKYRAEMGMSGDTAFCVVFDAKGNKCIGTENGLSFFDDMNFETIVSKDDLLGGCVYSIAIDAENKKWIGTNEGLFVFENDVISYVWGENIAIREIRDLNIAPNGDIWFYCGGDIVKLTGNTIGSFTINSNPIEAITFFDENSNGKKDNNEQLISLQNVLLNPTKTFLNNKNGIFSFYAYNRNHQLKALPYSNWQLTTPETISFEVKNGKTDTPLEFGFAPKENKPDLSIDLVGKATRAFFNTRYWITAENTGMPTNNAVVKMKVSPLLTFNSASVAPSSITDSEIVWDIDGLGLFEQKQIIVNFTVAGVEHMGEEIMNTVTIESNDEDIDFSDNSFTLKQIMTGSYDPNDKKEEKGILDKGYTLFNEELHYTIRFQNTGTDTAFNIKILDTLDTKLDISSFRLKSSSHPCTFDLDEKGIVKFRFKNILLPDSIVNEPASHGYVKYSIKPQEGFEENEEVHNTAHIYFDYNPAIVTNTTLNTFVSELPVSIETIGNAYGSLEISPNPASKRIIVKDVENSNFTIINTLGEIVSSNTMNGNTVNVSALPNGVYELQIGNRRGAFVIAR